MALSAVLLDMDGTLWASPVDWMDVRRSLGLPQDGRSIMEHLDRWDPAARARGLAILEEFEVRGACEGALMPGARELVAFIREMRLQLGLVTNNSLRSTARVLKSTGLRFDLIATRDDNPMKPAPASFLAPLSRLGAAPTEAVAVGDTHLDVAAAWGAGLREVVLVAAKSWTRPLLPREARYVEVASLYDVQDVLAACL